MNKHKGSERVSKFQTRTHLLIEILLEKAEGDVILSDQRVCALQKIGDNESANIEREQHKKHKEKVSALETLLANERVYYEGGLQPFVHIGYIKDGRALTLLEYESKRIKEVQNED